MLAVYAIVNGNQEGWTSVQTLGLLGLAAVLLVAFLGIESRVEAPLMPLRLFRLRNLATANVVGILWAAAMFAWFFLAALYMQLVLGYTPLEGRFEEGPIGRTLAEHGVTTALERGVWGVVLCSNAAPHHPMWALREWQIEQNRRITG